MHGFVHQVFKKMVVEKHGEAKWIEIRESLGLSSDNEVLKNKQYDDKLTVQTMVVAAKVLQLSVADAMRTFGQFYGKFICRSAHLRLLESLGDTLEAFLRNMNHIHFILERSYRASNFPVFKVSKGSGSGRPGKDPSDDEEGITSRFKLSYLSKRGDILAPFLEGALPVFARHLHGEHVTMKLVPPEEDFSSTWQVVTQREMPTVGARVMVVAETFQSDCDSRLMFREHSCGIVRKVDAQGHFFVRFDGCEDDAFILRRNMRKLRIVMSDSPDGGPSPDFWQWHTALASLNLGFCCTSRVGQLPSGSSAEVVSTTDHPELQRRHSVNLAEMVGGLPPSEAATLDLLISRLSGACNPGAILMRAVKARRVAAGWDSPELLDRASKFWSSNEGRFQDYHLSEEAQYADLFVSHMWMEPENWKATMGGKCSYGAVKATELKMAADEIAESLGGKWEDVTFWIDKCCIPQQHAVTVQCLTYVEDFLQRCDGMLVVFTWDYFTRLWCVYEWAAFLVYHDPSNVMICVDNFLRPDTIHLFVESIEKFSMSKAECYNDNDKEMLKRKVETYYNSEADFDRFAQGTAVAMVAATCVRRASRSAKAYEEQFLPWVELAERLEFHDLADELREARPLQWREGAQEAAASAAAELGGSSRSTWQGIFGQTIERWFKHDIKPELDYLRRQCVKKEVLAEMDKKRTDLLNGDRAFVF